MTVKTWQVKLLFDIQANSHEEVLEKIKQSISLGLDMEVHISHTECSRYSIHGTKAQNKGQILRARFESKRKGIENKEVVEQSK